MSYTKTRLQRWRIGSQTIPAVLTLMDSKAVVTATHMNLGPSATVVFALDSEGCALVKLRDTVVRDTAAKFFVKCSQCGGGPRTLHLLVCGAFLEDQGAFL